MDGHPPPSLPLWDAMQLWAAAAKGTAGGRDGITQEMFIMWAIGLKVLLWSTFREMLLLIKERRCVAPASWDLLDLAGLPNAELQGGWADFRWIAKAAVMAKHWHRFLIASAMSLPRAHPVQTYGFSRGFRTADVLLAVSWAAALAQRFPYDLVVLEANIRWCFDVLGSWRAGLGMGLLGASRGERGGGCSGQLGAGSGSIVALGRRFGLAVGLGDQRGRAPPGMGRWGPALLAGGFGGLAVLVAPGFLLRDLAARGRRDLGGGPGRWAAPDGALARGACSAPGGAAAAAGAGPRGGWPRAGGVGRRGRGGGGVAHGDLGLAGAAGWGGRWTPEGGRCRGVARCARVAAPGWGAC